MHVCRAGYVVFGLFVCPQVFLLERFVYKPPDSLANLCGGNTDHGGDSLVEETTILIDGSDHAIIVIIINIIINMILFSTPIES